MKAVLQRVSEADVLVDQTSVGRIGKGLVLLWCAEEGDSHEDADWLIQKILKLRIFEDLEGRMNLDLGAVEGAILLVSQFTLAADMRKGNRPSFSHAMKPGSASEMIEYVAEHFRAAGVSVEEGLFGAHMELKLVNDGPVTLILDSNERHRPRNS